jgi:hypothetical protein
MALVNKAAIESEYTAKAVAIRAITPAQIDTTLASVAAFILQCREAVVVLEAREALNSRPLQGGDIATTHHLIDSLENGLAQVRAAVLQLQATLPA